MEETEIPGTSYTRTARRLSDPALTWDPTDVFGVSWSELGWVDEVSGFYTEPIPDIINIHSDEGTSAVASNEPKIYAVYMRRTRAEGEFREWVIMPPAAGVPANVWTRYLRHSEARPVWRGTLNKQRTDRGDERIRDASIRALDAVAAVIAEQTAQNKRFPSGNLWTWEEPIVVECTEHDVVSQALKTPYTVLRRINKVREVRIARATAAGGPKNIEPGVANPLRA